MYLVSIKGKSVSEGYCILGYVKEMDLKKISEFLNYDFDMKLSEFKNVNGSSTFTAHNVSDKRDITVIVESIEELNIQLGDL